MRRAVVVLGAIVLTGLIGAVVAAGYRAEMSGRATAAGSSFRADEAGHRAARLLIESVGYDVRSRRGAQLPEGRGHVLVRIEGLPGALPDDVPEWERSAAGAALARWVEGGNAVLVLGGATPSGTGFPRVRDRDELPDSGIRFGPVAPATPDGILDEIFGARPDVPSDGAEEREHHALPGLEDPWITPYFVVTARDGDEVLAARVVDYDDAREPVVVESRRGDGRVIVVGDPWFATNVRLGRADNAAWLVALVERLADGGDVWFDDRALGQVSSRGVLSLMQEAGFGPALLAGFLLLFVVWWRVGPSDAPDRMVRPRKEYRPEAYAELRAGLYASCLAPDDVRRMVHDEVARRLGRGDGVSFERVLSLLQTRDPERAARLQSALDDLPQHRDILVTRYAATWSAAVARVWDVLDEGSRTRAQSAKETS
jgi:hypothetical protein